MGVTSDGVRIVAPLPNVRLKTRVIEYVQTYAIGQPVACPIQQSTAAKSRRFLEPSHRELSPPLKNAVRRDEGVRELVSDPTADPS